MQVYFEEYVQMYANELNPSTGKVWTPKEISEVSGIPRSLADEFAAVIRDENARVMTTELRPANNEELLAALKAKYGGADYVTPTPFGMARGKGPRRIADLSIEEFTELMGKILEVKAGGSE